MSLLSICDEVAFQFSIILNRKPIQFLQKNFETFMQSGYDLKVKHTSLLLDIDLLALSLTSVAMFPTITAK